MPVIGNVEVSGLDLSPAMRSALASGISAADFNRQFAGRGFRPISLSRQVGAAPAPTAPPPPAYDPGAAQRSVDQAIARQRAEQEALLARQKAEQEGYFGQYESTIAGQEKLPSIYQRLRTEQGLPELEQQAGVFKEQIFKTKDLLDRLDEDINARTVGTFTTEAQRRRQIAAEGEPLRTQLGRLGTGLEPISERLTAGLGQVSTLLGLESSERERTLKPLEMRIGALSDRFAREITGYTQSSQNELTALLDKLENERRLEQREWERVQQLAAEEREFARQKALARSNVSAAGQYLQPRQAQAQPSATRKPSGGGFAFADTAGKPISAAKYAQLTGQNVLDVFRSMGQSGDTYAAQVYNQLKANPNSQNMPQVKQAYSALFWGT